MIKVERLSLSYREGRKREPVRVIDDLNLGVAEGESVVIIGPSGCGKTSLLYILAGLMRPTAGTITIGDEEIRKPQRDVALVLQDAGLLPWKTVWKNASLSLKFNGQDRRIGDGAAAAAARTRVRTTLSDLGLAELEHRYPAQLSGGQSKRVAIARALAIAPRVLLMDEPLVSLDAFTRERIQEMILGLWQRQRFTMVLVTHEMEEAVFLGQRIVVLSSRPATLKAIVDNPEMGGPGWRQSEAYYQQVRRVRLLCES
jgi:NitT/TauT family transport system ATP-binding protein